MNTQTDRAKAGTERHNELNVERIMLSVAPMLRKLFATMARLPDQFRRWKRACILTLFGMVLLCLALCILAVFFVGRASAQEGQWGSQLPLDVILLIDHSNSMWDKGGVGSDPKLLRVEAANLFVAYLGVDMARSGNRLGVIHFGEQSEWAVPLTPLDSAEQRQAIREAIANPQRMGWTDPLAALQMAYDVLFPQNQRDPTRHPVVVILSDGKPELAGFSSREYVAYIDDLRALVNRFRERDCPIFTVALSNEATDADPAIQTIYRNLWQEIAASTPPAEYREARAANDLPGIYHAIAAAVVASLAGAQAGTPVIETLVDGEAAQSVAIETGLSQVTLVVMRSDPALAVRLLRPGGAPARPDDPDVRRVGELGITREEIWSITDPRPGRWSLELQGHGTVTVWQDTIPASGVLPTTYVIEMASPPTFIPAGQPVEITRISVREISATDSTNETGSETMMQTDLQIIAELTRAGFVEAAFLAHDDGLGCDSDVDDGRYCVVIPDVPAGACTLRLRALRDGEEIARRRVVFEGVALPKLEVTSPSPTLSPTLSLGVETEPFVPAERQRSVSPLVWILALAVGSAGGGVLIWQRRERATLEGVLRVLTAPSSLPAPLRGGACPEPVERAGGGVVIDLPALSSAMLGGTETGKGIIPLPGGAPRVILRAARTPESDIETWVTPLPGKDAQAIALNDRPLENARRLTDGDVLTLGEYRLRYESLRQAGIHRARHRPRRKRDSAIHS